MTTIAVSTTKTINVAGIGPVELTVEERGDGQPFLVLHGGAGPQSVAAFAQLLAEKDRNRVLTPIHPGFGGTPRPDELNSVAGLAALYSGLLDDLGLDDVTVIGNSVGGWVAAEMALLGSPRISGIVLLDAVGIEVEGHPVADVSGLISARDPGFLVPRPDALPCRSHQPSPMPRRQSWPPTGRPWPSTPALRRWLTLRCSAASAASLSRPWCCGATVIRLSSPPTARPMPLLSAGRGSRYCRPPGTCPRWRRPISCWKGFRTCKVSPLTNPKRRVVDW